MDNITPFLFLKLDKERKFRLSNKAFYIFESEFGRRTPELDFNCLDITEVNQMIYAGLKSQDESVTFKQVVDIIDEFGNLPELGIFLNKACSGSSFLQPKDSKAKKAPKN